MKIFYITPSSLPSLSANSVHVMNQCAALWGLGAKVTLVARRTEKDKGRFLNKLKATYGNEQFIEQSDIVTFYSSGDKGAVPLIALRALWHLLTGPGQDLIFSRNLYAAFFIAVIFRKGLIFETHQLELGFRKWMQRKLVCSEQVQLVVISAKLKQLLSEHLNADTSKAIILHDAAPEGIIPVWDKAEKKKLLHSKIPETTDWRHVVGYFGHLFPGRGIEVIELLADEFPETLFVVFGGTPDLVRQKRSTVQSPNILFKGHLAHTEALDLMRLFDALLMPYQKQVSIGIKGHDTAKWMSPMKMFEYLASGVPVISSDLPVLREVLKDHENALLVPPDNVAEWANAVRKVITDESLASSLGKSGYHDYKADYTWSSRAKKIMEFSK